MGWSGVAGGVAPLVGAGMSALVAPLPTTLAQPALGGLQRRGVWGWSALIVAMAVAGLVGPQASGSLCLAGILMGGAGQLGRARRAHLPLVLVGVFCYSGVGGGSRWGLGGALGLGWLVWGGEWWKAGHCSDSVHDTALVCI